MLGDILVYWRPKGHHVGMYIAESVGTFLTLGGNQGNAYSAVEIEKSRLLAARRFYAIAPPASVKKYYIQPSGEVSENES